MHSFPRPTEPYLSVERRRVADQAVLVVQIVLITSS